MTVWVRYVAFLGADANPGGLDSSGRRPQGVGNTDRGALRMTRQVVGHTLNKGL
jgi:hypothetical protein